MNDIDKSIARLLAAYESAVHARDAEALLRLYDPKVRVFDTWGVWFHDGADAWRVAVDGWFASLGTERVKVRFDEVRTRVDGGSASGFALVTAIVTYAGISAEGATLREMQNRLTWGLATSGHVLRIVHEHTSVPVGFEDAKAILRRVGGR